MAHRVLVPPPIPPPPPTLFIEDVFTVTSNGQTLFALTQLHNLAGLNVVAVNGVTYDDGVDYSITTTQVQWLNNLFSLQIGDEVIVKYQKT